MNQRKCKIIISIILGLVILLLTLNDGVFATDTTTHLDWNSISGNNDNNEIPVINNNNENENNDIDIEIETPIKDADVEEKNNVNKNTVNDNIANNNIANTGIEDLFGSRSITWVVLGFCIISAVFAYKKIKEYNNIG